MSPSVQLSFLLMRNPPDPLERCLDQTPSRQYLRFDFTLDAAKFAGCTDLGPVPSYFEQIAEGQRVAIEALKTVAKSAAGKDGRQSCA